MSNKTEKMYITAEYPEHGMVILISPGGDTYTSKDRELLDFLCHCNEPTPEDKELIARIQDLSNTHFEQLMD